MANILRNLNINGVEYNIGYSQNDLTNELKAKYDAMEQNAINAGKVAIAEAAGSGDILKTYTFTQNGAEIGRINLAKDLVVSGGEIVEKEGVKYLSLSIANQEAPVEIPVADLVDVYTGSTYINITDGNVVELKVSDLDAHLAAEGSAVGNKLKANAEAAAAADAKGAQGISDAAAASAAVAAEQGRAEGVEQGLRADLGQSNAAAGTGSAFARIKSLEAEIESLSGGAGSISNQIDEKITAYDTATVQPIAGDVATIKGDYLKAADKTELNQAIGTKVAQSAYDTKMSALDKSISDNATAIGNNADAIDTMGQKLAGISAGANKTTYTYVESTATLNIVTA